MANCLIPFFILLLSQKNNLWVGGEVQDLNGGKTNISASRGDTSLISYEIFVHFVTSFNDVMIFDLCIRAKCLSKAKKTKYKKESDDIS